LPSAALGSSEGQDLKDYLDVIGAPTKQVQTQLHRVALSLKRLHYAVIADLVCTSDFVED
jgi:hypothetical protein